jgi:hypothetical protein
MDLDTYHCEECNICINGYDHHCDLFSKCIGSRNIIYFYSSVVFLIINLVVISIFYMLYGDDSELKKNQL